MDLGISGTSMAGNASLPSAKGSIPRRTSGARNDDEKIKFGGYRPKSSKALSSRQSSSRHSSRGSERSSRNSSREQSSAAAKNFKESIENEIRSSDKAHSRTESSQFKLDGAMVARLESESAKMKNDIKEEPKKAIKCKRAKTWSIEVEWQFRLQETGWKDIYEYKEVYGDPELWPDSNLPKCLRTKESGLYSYWKPTRECPDKFLARVKIYEYAS
mmetsp:Transcript_38771/g.51087  ORF Transcript_38771/g.51087 Transcript_38771/m.51087 type:complete len:216 (-) Transcript_38771:75-722(-)